MVITYHGACCKGLKWVSFHTSRLNRQPLRHVIITLKGALSLETNPTKAASKLDTDASHSCVECEMPNMSTNYTDVVLMNLQAVVWSNSVATAFRNCAFAVCIPWPLKAKLVSTASCYAPAEPERILTIATSRLRVSSISV